MTEKLIHIETGNEVKIGDTLTDFRGETAKLVGFYYNGPYKSGKVQVEGRPGEYYDKVFGCRTVQE